MVGVGWQVVVVGDGGRGQYVTHIHKFERLARKSWNNRCGRKIFAGHSARDTSGQSARPLVSKRAALVRDPLSLAAGRLLIMFLTKGGAQHIVKATTTPNKTSAPSVTFS